MTGMIALDHLTIPVRDVARSRDWYTTVLGLKVEFDIEAARVAALQDTSGFTLFVAERPAAECVPSCALTFRVDDVEAAAAAIAAKGAALSAAPQKLFWGYGAELHDPDGYLIRLWDEQSMREKG
jgi:catechol 2,3-dioxygenase-like lactoylglutathione lyase family enzyme